MSEKPLGGKQYRLRGKGGIGSRRKTKEADRVGFLFTLDDGTAGSRNAQVPLLEFRLSPAKALTA